MARASTRTQPSTRTHAVGHMAKAEEFLEAAQDALLNSHTNAAFSMAVHAGVQASDVICSVKLEKRSSSANHADAVDLLGSIPGPEKTLAQKLKRLLSNKTKAEYDAEPVSAAHAKEAVLNAERLVERARSVLEGANPRIK